MQYAIKKPALSAERKIHAVRARNKFKISSQSSPRPWRYSVVQYPVFICPSALYLVFPIRTFSGTSLIIARLSRVFSNEFTYVMLYRGVIFNVHSCLRLESEVVFTICNENSKLYGYVLEFLWGNLESRFVEISVLFYFISEKSYGMQDFKIINDWRYIVLK